MENESTKIIKSSDRYWRLGTPTSGFLDHSYSHILVASLHLFFIGVAVWMDRWDLALLGIIFSMISAYAFYVVISGNLPDTVRSLKRRF